MRKSHFNDEFLVLLGPIISSLFTRSNKEKKGACSSPISMVLTFLPIGIAITCWLNDIRPIDFRPNDVASNNGKLSYQNAEIGDSQPEQVSML